MDIRPFLFQMGRGPRPFIWGKNMKIAILESLKCFFKGLHFRKKEAHLIQVYLKSLLCYMYLSSQCHVWYYSADTYLEPKWYLEILWQGLLIILSDLDSLAVLREPHMLTRAGTFCALTLRLRRWQYEKEFLKLCRMK